MGKLKVVQVFRMSVFRVEGEKRWHVAGTPGEGTWVRSSQSLKIYLDGLHTKAIGNS